jgi:hypothetical protein
MQSFSNIISFDWRGEERVQEDKERDLLGERC